MKAISVYQLIKKNAFANRYQYCFSLLYACSTYTNQYLYGSNLSNTPSSKKPESILCSTVYYIAYVSTSLDL